MERVRVILYDDVHYQTSKNLIEADASHILELDGRRVKLDLTDANFQVLASELDGFLAAGSPARDGAAPTGRAKAQKRSGQLNPERLMFNQAIRLWAAWQGRVAETRVPTGYYYKIKLRKDVAAWLNERGIPAAEFVARAEAGEYPPKEEG